MLPPPMSRTSASADLDGTDPDSVRSAYARLAALPAGLELLRAWAEVRAVIGEAGARLEVAVHRDLHDQQSQEAQRRWTSRVCLEAERGDQELAERFDEPLLGGPLPEAHAPMLAQIRRNRHPLPDPALLEREHALTSRYAELRHSAWPVEVEGAKLGPAELAQALGDPDRARRERVWRARMQALLSLAEPVDELFSELVTIRHALAQAAGDPSYREYRYRELHRDWTPADAAALREVIEAEVVPALTELDRRAAAELGLPGFAPWDHDAAPGLQAPDFGALGQQVGARMAALDPELGELFGLLWPAVDHERAPSRRQADFHAFFPASRRSVVFLTPLGRAYDEVTLVHELGHAMHAARSALRQPWACVDPPLEVCELAAHGHEALHLSSFSPALRRHYLHNLLRTIVVCALLDEMQDWAATCPQHTVPERQAKWDELVGRFLPGQPLDWHQGPRIGAAIPYLRPFYALEYSYANLGALSLGRRHAEDPADALVAYKALLDAGPGPADATSASLYAVAGLTLVPSPDELRASLAWALDGSPTP
jgi:oligoendopeptidase F